MEASSRNVTHLIFFTFFSICLAFQKKTKQRSHLTESKEIKKQQQALEPVNPKIIIKIDK